MVRSCCAYNCSNKLDKNYPELHFHRFPFSRPETCMKWIAAVRRKDWWPNKTTDICSEHFLDTDYEEQLPGDMKRRLKLDAVPSKFDYPQRFIERDVEGISERSIPEPKPEVESENDENYTDASSPNTSGLSSPMEKNLSLTNIRLKMKIKALEQKVKRKREKIKVLKAVVKKVKDKGRVSDELYDVLSHF